MSEYTVRIGTSAALRSVKEDIYSIPYRATEDDGKVILCAGRTGAYSEDGPVCGDCGVGHLRWAEGGYVAWHRICEVCGSHWDLHTIEYGPTKPTVEILYAIEDRDTPRKELCWQCEDEGSCPEHPYQPRVAPVPPDYVRFRNGYIPLDPADPLGDSGKTWGDLLALVTPEDWDEARRQDNMANAVTVRCAWARRARFY